MKCKYCFTVEHLAKWDKYKRDALILYLEGSGFHFTHFISFASLRSKLFKLHNLKIAHSKLLKFSNFKIVIGKQKQEDDFGTRSKTK